MLRFRLKLLISASQEKYQPRPFDVGGFTIILPFVMPSANSVTALPWSCSVSGVFFPFSALREACYNGQDCPDLLHIMVVLLTAASPFLQLKLLLNWITNCEFLFVQYTWSPVHQWPLL